jgi:hypothetical protein
VSPRAILAGRTFRCDTDCSEYLGSGIAIELCESVVGYYAKWRSFMAYLGNGLEHRWGERVKVNIPVRVEGAALPGANGCMKNLSLSGALMKSDSDLRLYTLIEVSVALPAPSTRTAVIKAHVSRKVEEGVGIEWYEFAPNIIRDLLRSALRSPPSA